MALLNANRKFTAALLLYIVAAFLLLPFYVWNLSPDSICYISIAEKYLAGNFTDAVNGYWGPLFSWILIVPIYLGVYPLVASKLVMILLSIILFFIIRRSAKYYNIDEQLLEKLYFFVIPVFLYFTYWVVTPDLLIAVCILLYLNIIFKDNYPDKLLYGILAGITGSLIYFSKTYGFPFFLIHFTVFSFLFLYTKPKPNRINVIRNYIIGLLCFAMMSGIWIYIISNKYEELTYGTSGRYNVSLFGPETKGVQFGLAVGFNPPSNETAVSSWEDASYLEVKEWSPLNSVEDFVYTAKLALENTTEFLLFITGFSPLFLILLIVNLKKIKFKEISFYSLLTIVLYSFGYILINLETRYIYLIYILVLLLSGMFFTKLMTKLKFVSSRKYLFQIIFLISLLLFPLYALQRPFKRYNKLFSMSDTLKNTFNIQGNVASDTSWTETNYLSYVLDLRYYNEAKDNWTEEELIENLKQYEIDYYFQWNMETPDIENGNVREITNDKLKNLRIYQIDFEGAQ